MYLHCVCIQVEKHFSQRRNLALQGKSNFCSFSHSFFHQFPFPHHCTAWEKKTDITTAINIATKKRLPLLVKELKSKLASLGPEASHTNVKEAKERHLGSKALKGELEALAGRRFNRLKERSLDRVQSLVRVWVDRKYMYCGLCSIQNVSFNMCEQRLFFNKMNNGLLERKWNRLTKQAKKWSKLFP